MPQPEILIVDDDANFRGLLEEYLSKQGFHASAVADGEDAIELAGLVGKSVVHVHASDRDERLEHSVAGEGCVPFPEIFQALKASGFDGWISLEAGGPGGKKGIIEGIRYIKKVWESA